ncbi:MAG: hypothetical protein ACM3O7_02585 [Acidobacteriota bacterium]
MPTRLALLSGMVTLVALVPVLLLAAPLRTPAVSPAAVDAAVAKLVASQGAAQEMRIRQGVAQVAARWWAADGDEATFVAFCTANFIADPAQLAATFARLEQVEEQVYGHLHEVRREILTPLDLDTGPVTAVDRLLAEVDLAAHVTPDLFTSKVAFVALLNFPVDTLARRLEQGRSWDRETWARSRMMDQFSSRVPASVGQDITRAGVAADQYIAGYNIRLDRLVTPEGKRLFPEGLRLISHWGLRDELASQYGASDGLARQRMIEKVMERIVRQEIPAVVVDNPAVTWCPETNEARPVPPGRATPRGLDAREPDTRYARWLATFHALREADPFTPTAPTAIARAFDVDRQIPENEVEALFVSVLASPEVREVAALIRRRLGRPLEPFDIWYPGFKARASRSESELDRIVASRYPTVAAFQSDLPRILNGLGFAPEKAGWLAANIVVDPSRGAGHAMGASRRQDAAHLRTRVAAGGMDYKGYNIAIHELGHNVEQTFSLKEIDHWFLSGVPNNAFTEAFAFSFQNRDLELLGVAAPGTGSPAEEALPTVWATYEIAGVSLVDMRAWRWLYAHPDATPAELREAVLAAARDVWNTYFAPVLGTRDSEILAIYSHMVAYPLYLPDYALGHIIWFEIAEKLRGGDFGAQFERMARLGRLTPDEWMREAVGSPISAAPLLAAARKAVEAAR